ncbi:GNAT family N-acetyltransferase [Nocardioides sp. TF02-7]|uniref:GNAT family N-acetyltransferase n=1 Tax=Nocardioides sp. TF02-7 TaxID=2917724 RepID=UPI001F05B470|nr:GNAT family N-acetyltransferase [Nocardioides sp. TF02-7]UMG93384.1 GNAT family N-acetyltransferase [Nocardioides sp. TF02-7]
MLWRVRANLPDRPGALGAVAHECGRAGVNILRIQVFPGRATVTDELVVSTPDDWQERDLAAVLERAGAESVVGLTCSEAALDDQPTRFVRAAQEIIDHPASFPDVVAHLFDADVAPSGGTEDVLELTVGNAVVQVRRDTPFTATERERGAAMAELVSHVLHREVPPGPTAGGEGGEPEYVASGDAVTALSSGRVAGRASVTAGATPDDPWPVDLWVDPSWQRRGIGTRLLGEVARLARSRGATEIVLTAPADSQAVLPMVLSAGMRGRIRMAGETVTVRIAVSELRAG